MCIIWKKNDYDTLRVLNKFIVFAKFESNGALISWINFVAYSPAKYMYTEILKKIVSLFMHQMLGS